MSWEERWETKNTPWDQGASAPSLVDLLEASELPAGRALVPGAGAGYDVLTLASADRSVMGVDLAPGAVETFRGLRERAGVPASRAEMVCADFFTWETSARFDLIYDYTFLCAIPPELRPAWRARVDELLVPGGELLMLIFPVEPPFGDPPYQITPEMACELLGDDFEPLHLEPASRSVESRQGREWLGRWRRRS